MEEKGIAHVFLLPSSNYLPVCYSVARTGGTRLDSNYWQRRISRRRLLAGVGATALGTAAALTVGCGGDSKSTSTAAATRRPAGSPVSGGSLTWGRDTTIGGIDPHIDLTGLDIDQLVYTYLYRWDRQTESLIFTELAESLEQPTPLDFIFTLRHGVMNQPGDFPGAGEEITSEDVKASFIRRGTSLTAIDKRFPQRIAGSKDPNAVAPVLKTPDRYTFSFTMSDYFAPALREMANATWAIVPRKVIDKYGTGLAQKAFGSGPFMLDEFKGNSRVALKRHPNFFKPGLPYLDEITFVIITQESSLLSAFKEGQHDINGASLTKDDFTDLAADDRFVTQGGPDLFYPCYHLKMQRAPFDDIRVREAMDLAIDRDQILAVASGNDGNYNGPIQWAQPNWTLPQDELRAFYKHDPDRARQLLSDAGYPGGFSAKMKFPGAEPGFAKVGDTAALLKDQWSRVGINVDLLEQELGTFISATLLSGNFEIAFFANVPSDEPDRPLAFYQSTGVTGTGNWNNYSNPALDVLIDQQSRETDPVKRKDEIFAAQRMILPEHGPQVTLTGGYAYNAQWNYVYGAYDAGDSPYGESIWMLPH
jgi:peptide/nickel transport system substrate-binding protein